MYYNYGRSCYESQPLKFYAKALLQLKDPKVRVLVCSGTSGLSFASAMAALSKAHLTVLYINKDGESSHRTRDFGTAEWVTNTTLTHKAAFVDDLISMGNTIAHCVKVIHDNKLRIKVTEALLCVPTAATQGVPYYKVVYQDAVKLKVLPNVIDEN